MCSMIWISSSSLSEESLGRTSQGYDKDWELQGTVTGHKEEEMTQPAGTETEC